LARTLSDEYDVVVPEDATIPEQSFDLCLLDEDSLARNADALERRKRREEPHVLPAVLLSSASTVESVSGRAWEYVDDVVTRPLSKRVLRQRVATLLRMRELSRQRVQSERWFDSVIATASDAVVIIDDDAVIQFANDAIERVLGYDAESLIGESVTTLIPDRMADQAATGIRRHLESHTLGASTNSFETTAAHRLGHEIPVRLSYSTFSYAGDLYLTGFVHDISESKRREQRLRVLNRVLRHDIRNDINVVMGYADLILGGTDDVTRSAELIKENARDIVRIADRARKLESLIDSEQLARSRYDVVSLLREQLRQYAREWPDAEISFDAPESLSVTAINLLESAFDNVLENAFEHNDSTVPHIDVQIRPPTAETDLVTVRISDNGPGIPETELDSLADGTEDQVQHTSGLGLWLVTWIISESGGTVQFASSDSEGATVTIRLEPAEAADSRSRERC
jgi:PAS domain S-box-containing protein